MFAQSLVKEGFVYARRVLNEIGKLVDAVAELVAWQPCMLDEGQMGKEHSINLSFPVTCDQARAWHGTQLRTGCQIHSRRLRAFRPAQ